MDSSRLRLDEELLARVQQVARRASRPRILPVRLAYWQPFQYPLSEYLALLNWAVRTIAARNRYALSTLCKRFCQTLGRC
ncbi:MAG: hypothetical protein AAGM45_02595 [Cyanobacteria bacterium J06588_5]